MAKPEIDWSKIRSVHDFENLVTTLVFLHDLLSVNLIKQIARSDLFWTTWHTENKSGHAFRVIFDNPGQDADQRDNTLRRKFDEKVAVVWRHDNVDTEVFLFLNFDDHPTDWIKDHKNLTIVTATDIAETIQDEERWAIFHKYFGEGMHIKDAQGCGFVADFAESLVPAVQELSVKEAINVMSWVGEIAFYRPKEVLAFAQTLFRAEKSTQEEKHPVFGTTLIGRNDYLEELSDLLQPVAAHFEYFGSALELLLRISSELDTAPHPLRGFLGQPVEKITGYYYGRDFLVRDNLSYYEPKFNRKTLQVIERLLGAENDSALLVRCLAVIPNLLRMRVDTSEWSSDNRAVTWREYRLPITDEGLQNVRLQALGLLFKAFNDSRDKEIRHRCLIELKEASHHLSAAVDLQSEFRDILAFLKAQVSDEDPFVLNMILEILESVSRAGSEAIKSEATSLQSQLNEKFELRLYYLLFGKKGWDPSSDDVLKAVQQSHDRWGDDPRALLLLIDEFHKGVDSHPTGLRTFLQSMGYNETEFAAEMISIMSGIPTLRNDLAPLFVSSLGYLLCGIRRNDIAQWQNCVETLLAEPDDNSVTIVLTGLHLHEYDNYTRADLELVEKLTSGASDNIRILGAETLWYFHKLDDFTAVLNVFESLSKNMTQELAASVLKGISHGSYQEGFANKWVTEDRRGILKKIIFSLSGFPRLDWDSMSGYELEVLLGVLWKYSTDDLLEFFQLRLDPERVGRENYDPLPYDLNTLFQAVSDEKQNEFVSRVLNWDVERYGIYWIARLIGLVCSKNVQPTTVATLRDAVNRSQKNQLLLITSILDQIPLSATGRIKTVHCGSG